MALSRTPPMAVVRQLRGEVGFRCPVSGCGRPYLSWHHFGPPWRIEQHHRPEGMIALCIEHAAHADAGAFTDDQLRAYKRDGRRHAQEVQGEFNWLRQELLAVVGGNFYYRTPVVFQIGSEPCIWFRRANSGDLLLNFWIPTTSGEPRARVADNIWMVPPGVADVECPPRGRILGVTYPNGDHFRVEFFSMDSATDLARRYPDFSTERWSGGLLYPITAVEVWERAPGTPIEFGPSQSRIGGIQMRGCYSENCGAGIVLDELPPGVGGRAFEGDNIRLSDLIYEEGRSTLERMKFSECHIEGPGVLIPQGTVFNQCNMGGDADQILWTLPVGPRVGGGIAAVRCLFDQCSLENVGIGVPDSARGETYGALGGRRSEGRTDNR